METKLISINDFWGKVEKPMAPHITYGQEPVTEAELERRLQIAEELESLGISISKFDTEDEHEDEDVLKAIIYVNQGKEIPEDLRKRLLKKKENRKKRRDISRLSKNRIKDSRTGRAHLK